MTDHHNAAAGRRCLPRLIAWEVTRSCMLACKHCRAAARPEPYPGELDTEECFRVLDGIASFARPIIILTGGEPMLRPDIYEIAACAHRLDLPVVMAPCGALIDDEAAAKIVRSGIRRISISLDGSCAATHDAFRGVDGAFDAALRGIEAARRAGLSFQINTTVTRHNLAELPAIRDLAAKLGATVFNPFLLVPTGRGKALADMEISPQQYEETLTWLAKQQGRGNIPIRVTCAPHYQRVLRQLGAFSANQRPARGCMGGQSFAFISHRGKAQICGFLDVECGDLRKEDFDFRKIWETSEVFGRVRDVDSYHGRCGYCEFRSVCGGCRARAYALTGDYLAEEPFCLYQPRRRGRQAAPAPPDEPGEPGGLDEAILSAIQADFPVAERPFDILAERLGRPADEIIRATARLRNAGFIRRIGAVFDSRSLGYASTLIAARVPAKMLAAVAEIVSDLPGVTHNYQRDHAYNLWFTLTAESEEQIRQTIEDLKARTGIADLHSLPALAVYKVRAVFPVGDGPGAPPSATAGGRSTRPLKTLSDDQKQLVRLLQDQLPLTRQPFADLAGRLGWPGGRVLEQINDWLAAGVIRRLGAIVRHRRLGYRANAMAVFRVPDDRADELGRRLAARPDVSHCYRRLPLDDFNYNLFAMVHGQSADQVRQLVAAVAKELLLSEYDALFSVTEFKKTSMRYFT